MRTLTRPLRIYETLSVSELCWLQNYKLQAQLDKYLASIPTKESCLR